MTYIRCPSDWYSSAFLIIGTIVLTLMKGKDSYYKCPEDAPQWEPVKFSSKVVIGAIIIIALIALIVDIIAVTGGFGDYMSTPAMAMLTVACVGLWGGIAVSLTITMKNNRERQIAAGKGDETLVHEYSEADMNFPDRDEK